MSTTFDPLAAAGLHGRVQLRLPGDAFVLTLQDARMTAVRGDEPCDALLAGTVRAVQDLVFERMPLEEAVRSGAVHVAGDTALLGRLLAAFDDGRASRVDTP